MKTRFAPTPSGFLHAGNRFNLQRTADLRDRHGGTLLLRIDDLDAERMRPEYLTHIFGTLREMDIRWDEGPRDEADFLANWSQHHRLPDYHRLLDRLRETGAVYACRCTRKTRAACGCDRLGLPLDTPDAVWRVRWDHPHDPNLDIVRLRDGRPSYQIASLSDDIRFGITHIVRGEDLRSSTAFQLHLADLLRLDAFLTVEFHHHALVLDAEGNKLSKSTAAGHP